MLPKPNRLKKRTEFQYSYKHGKTAHFKEFSVVVFARRDKLLRIGFSVSKKIGKATVRNHVKRQLRAIVNKQLSYIKRGYNLIFVAHESINLLEFGAICDKIYLALTKLNLLEHQSDSI